MTTIISENTLNIQESTEGWTLRAYAEENFIDAGGGLILGSQIDDKGAYFAAPFAEGSTAIPAIDLPPTTSSLDNRLVRYSVLGIYDRRGRQKHTLLSDFFLPDSLGETTTLADLMIANRAQRVPYLPAGVYSAEQIDAKLATAASIAAVQAVPLVEAQLNTDYPVLPASTNTRYLGEFASLTAAVSDIGSAPSVLEISTANVTGPNSDLTIPANIRVRFTGKGSISVRSGKTLTINALDDPGSRQVFYGAGNVILGQNNEHYNLAWWVGLGNNADAGQGLSNIVTSLGSTQGEIYFPHTQPAQFTDFAVNSNIILPSTSSLRFAPGARLKIGTGVTVKLPDAPNAGKHQIFSLTGTGKVIFDTQITALPHWWGAIDDGSNAQNSVALADRRLGDNFVFATGSLMSVTGTDNTAALQAALDAINQSGGGTLDVRTNKGFVVAGSLNQDNNFNVRMLGNAGIYNYSAGTKNLIFTGAPTDLISAKSCFNCVWERVGFYHTNNAFTGNMLLIGFNANGDPGYNRVLNCSFSGRDGVVPSAKAGINLQHTITTSITGCSFFNTIYGITNEGYANVIAVKECMFLYCKSYAIYLTVGAESWNITDNTFEGSNEYGGNKPLTRALKAVGSCWSISFSNNWLGDGTAGLGTDDPMVELVQVYGFSIFQNRFANYNNTLAYGVSINECIAGSIRENRFEYMPSVKFPVTSGYSYSISLQDNNFYGTQDFTGLLQGFYQNDGTFRFLNYGLALEINNLHANFGVPVRIGGGGTAMSAVNHGTGVTAGGHVTVSYPAITDDSRVFVTGRAAGAGMVAVPYLDHVTPGTGFVVLCDDGDAAFSWMVIEP